jgi:type IV secretory pathway TraG/TraD family ATPase VirD4
MSFRASIERIDADYFIPRPADEPDLDSFHAATRFFRDFSRGATLILSSLIAAYLLFRSGEILNLEFKWMTFVFFGAMFAALIGVFESASLAYPYYSINQRLTHGSARWATIGDLKAKGLAHLSSKPLPPGSVRIGRLSSALSPRQYDLVLGLKPLLTHTGIFGPSDSGKSATFYMNILRDWSDGGGSAIVMDIKGELYAHTARYYDRVYRLDLETPEFSDLWNPLPRCLNNGQLSHSIASIVVGYEPDNMKVNDGTHYWISGETALMTALCRHLPTIATNPTLPMIKEYLSLNDLAKLAEDMHNSKDHEAKIEWGNFTKVDPEKTQGGVITGLNNKLGPLRSPNCLQILKTATPEELARGVREINLADLRKPRTAIYVVISESDAKDYRILLELFFGLAAIEMQFSTHKNSTPVLVALDEAGNTKPPKLEERLKIGRFRNTPYLLGFQDVSQIKAKWGENAGRAILAGIRNQIFLPGIDPETGVYASSLLGSTTVLSRTEVDAPGIKNDAERVSESRRDLRQAPELRRMVKYRQGIAIVDTADPILFRFRSPADNGDVAVASKRALLPAPSLAEAVAATNEIRAEEKRRIEEAKAIGAASVANQTDQSAAVVETKSNDESEDATDEKALRKLRVQFRQNESESDQKVLPFGAQKNEEEAEEDSCAA